MYHSISREATPAFRPWTVSPELFEAHMGYLRHEQFTPMTVTQLGRAMAEPGAQLPARPVVITFDDGFADFYTQALPVLASNALAATLYVVSGLMGRTSRWLEHDGEGDRPMLTWSQLSDIQTLGVECGAHSLSHPQLDVLPRRAAWEEIRVSKALLEDRLAQTVHSFAYPHGYHDATVRELVQQAGYSSACGVKHALSALTDDRFGLARIIVGADTSVGRLERLLAGQGLAVAPTREKLQTKAWRVVRRSSARWHGGLGSGRPGVRAGAARG
jgi:peptidoglycan/xylan/chitin deacetylase (PgdA/CDA1 family)